MAEKIYFQWQNKILRDTIYPVRDMKLRHFLLYYYEVDLWAKYKDKKLADCLKEKAEYEASQKKAVTDAFKNERELRDYFIKPVSDTPSEENKDETGKFKKLLGRLHDEFGKYFDSYKNEIEVSSRDRKEKIFVAMRVADWEGYRKDMKKEIAKKKNLLSDPNATNKDIKTKELEILESILLPSLESELGQLKSLVSAQSKLEKRKEEFAKRQKALLESQDLILKTLEPLQKLIRTCEVDQKKVDAWVAKLSNPPDLKKVLDYFSSMDIYVDIRERFAKGDTLEAKKSVISKTVLARVMDIFRDTLGDTTHSFHKELRKTIKDWIGPEKRDPTWILQWIGGQAASVQKAQKKLDDIVLALEADTEAMRKSVPEGSTHISGELTDRLQVLNILRDTSDIGIRTRVINELDKLEDLQVVINHLQRSKEEIEKLIQTEKSELEKRLKKLLRGKDLSTCLKEEEELKKQLEPVKTALEIKREKYLSDYVPDQPVQKKDDPEFLKKEEERLKKQIVQFLADEYYAKLLGWDHDKLLEEVFHRFWNEPERFPLWLQYMVVHFSGMRYASAHGSWADPKELYLNLRTSEIQNDIKEELRKMDDGVLKASCDERVATYGPLKEPVDSSVSLPEYARAAASDKKFIKRFQEYYLAELTSPRPDKRHKAFFDLRIDEESCEIHAMKSENVLEELKIYKKEYDLPEWMWDEIVKLTDLRLTEVDSPEWETLSVEEQNKRNSNADKRMAKYRDIMNQWKAKYLTGWREEHERTNRLIVTRAVCNEVAEHIQHLRGHTGAAGLAEKPFWYKEEESKFYASKERPAGSRPYFVKAKSRNDFEVGASILWLRFVNEIPNEWRIARTIETRQGDGLIPSAYRGRNMESGGWVYYLDEPIKRSRRPVQKKGTPKAPTQNQWLRWMHEATVAAVEETAEGTVVLTFETTLPYEDPSVSTVGMLKRYLNDLTSDLGEDAFNPAFVGFRPEGKIPASDLEEMLDWNHILQKEAVSAAALETWREKYIRNRKPPKPTIQIIDTVERVKGKADLPICDFVKWTDSLVTPTNNLWKVRIWGDKKLGKDTKDLQTDADSNFQAVGVFIKETKQSSGVANSLKIGRDDIDKLMAMQIEDEFIQKQKKPGAWLNQKMSWLCKGEGTIYFTKGGKGWETAKSILWGIIALGGNLVQVEGEEEIDFKMDGVIKPVKMARLAGFKKTDWYRPLDELLAEGLVHRCFCVHGSRNKPMDTPKGIIYSPFFSPLEWTFAGQAKPKALYLPFNYLVKPGSKEYEEDVKKGYEGIAERLKCPVNNL